MTGISLRRAGMALALGFAAAASPGLAQDEPCAATPEDALRQIESREDPDVCLAEIEGWSLRLHGRVGRQSFLTSGSMLNIFNLPQPDDAVQAGNFLGVALLPVSDDLWKVAFLEDGVIRGETGWPYYVWAPSRNGRGPGQPRLDWSVDQPRFLRCLPYEGLRCITYYTVATCSGAAEEEPRQDPLVLSARREMDTESLAIFDGFAEVEARARALAERVRALRCDGPD